MGRGLLAGATLASVLCTAGGAEADTFYHVATFNSAMDDFACEDGTDPLPGGAHPISPDTYWILRATGNRIIDGSLQNVEYCIVAGPDPVTGGGSRIEIQEKPYPPDTEVVITYGIAYYIGTLPYGGTSGGSAAAEGSAFVAWHRGNGNDDIFALLEGKRLLVTNENASEVIDTINSYREVGAGAVGSTAPIVRQRDPDDALRERLWELARRIGYAKQEIDADPECTCAGFDRPLPY